MLIPIHRYDVLEHALSFHLSGERGAHAYHNLWAHEQRRRQQWQQDNGKQPPREEITFVFCGLVKTVSPLGPGGVVGWNTGV